MVSCAPTSWAFFTDPTRSLSSSCSEWHRCGFKKEKKGRHIEGEKILNCYTEEILTVILRGMKNSVKKRSQKVRRYNNLYHQDIFVKKSEPKEG